MVVGKTEGHLDQSILYREILKIKDLDIIYFGAYDLSQDLGCPGDIKNDKVTEISSTGYPAKAPFFNES